MGYFVIGMILGDLFIQYVIDRILYDKDFGLGFEKEGENICEVNIK